MSRAQYCSYISVQVYNQKLLKLYVNTITAHTCVIFSNVFEFI